MDKNCSSTFDSDNNVIYGHHMRDGSMFADLLKFREESFLKENQEITVYTPEKTLHLKVISAYAAGGDTLIPVTFASQEKKKSIYQRYSGRVIYLRIFQKEDQKK